MPYATYPDEPAKPTEAPEMFRDAGGELHIRLRHGESIAFMSSGLALLRVHSHLNYWNPATCTPVTSVTLTTAKPEGAD